MRQLKLQYGVLIGQVIQIFYDGDLTEYDDPILLETIDFEKDSQKGIKFVELFNKENFTYDALNNFTKNILKSINRKNEQKVLLNKIISPDYELKILELIKQDLQKEYDGEIIDNVLQGLTLKIATKNAIVSEIIKTPSTKYEQYSETLSTRDKTKYIINESGIKLGKNKFVLEFVRAYLKRNPSSFNNLKNIFLDEYQGSTGVINELKLVETKYANKSNKRHFIDDINILTSSDNVKFVVSTEWGKFNIDNIVNLAKKQGFKIEEV